jgi:hypothetical protein
MRKGSGVRNEGTGAGTAASRAAGPAGLSSGLKTSLPVFVSFGFVCIMHVTGCSHPSFSMSKDDLKIYRRPKINRGAGKLRLEEVCGRHEI